MRGLLLSFAGSVNIAEAVAEYEIAHQPPNGWRLNEAARNQVARSIEIGKGIPSETTLEYLTEAYGNVIVHADGLDLEKDPFDVKEPKEPKPKKQKKEDRWPEITDKAKDLVRNQPKMLGDELASALSGDLDEDLSQIEKEKVEKLVAPDRGKKLVGPVERIPKDERTPEIDELIDQEWSRIQEDQEKEKEKKLERTDPEKALYPKKPRRTPGSGMVPSIGPQAAKKSYADPESFLCEEYSELADGDGFRAFLEALALLRGGNEDCCIKDTIGAEYAGIDADTVLSAAKAFIKGGKSDPYINGGTLARKLVKQVATQERVKTVLSHLIMAQMDESYINGFHTVIRPRVNS